MTTIHTNTSASRSQSEPYSPLQVIAIVAMDEGRGIGFQNAVPWHIPEDLKHFARLTTGQTVLMGRHTYESLPERYRPLPHRRNVVASRSLTQPPHPDVELCDSAEQFVLATRAGAGSDVGGKLWVIGGAEIYQATLPQWDQVQLTLVRGTHAADAYFPPFEEFFELKEEVDRGDYAFRRYSRRLAA
ncbi:MAG: dihydrofolate reductase [Bdellovibrionales bacterium]|nr:dihydrofolate reductase [Bdellovibrionales bacterium]